MSEQRPARLYLVTRADLGEGSKVVQSAHALHHFVTTCQPASDEWFAGGGHMVALEAPDLDALESAKFKLSWHNIPHGWFVEPDMASQLTALVVTEAGAKFVRRFPMIGN